MSAERSDLYAVLGLAPSATQAEIRDAYRDLVRRHHPDTRAPQDPSRAALSDELLQRVLGAYAVLGDSARRASYDERSQHLGVKTAARPREDPVRRDRARSQPPIQAGPVYWQVADNS
jgi:curved DNA-binding protein CbpA